MPFTKKTHSRKEHGKSWIYVSVTHTMSLIKSGYLIISYCTRFHWTFCELRSAEWVVVFGPRKKSRAKCYPYANDTSWISSLWEQKKLKSNRREIKPREEKKTAMHYHISVLSNISNVRIVRGFFMSWKVILSQMQRIILALWNLFHCTNNLPAKHYKVNIFLLRNAEEFDRISGWISTDGAQHSDFFRLTWLHWLYFRYGVNRELHKPWRVMRQVDNHNGMR